MVFGPTAMAGQSVVFSPLALALAPARDLHLLVVADVSQTAPASIYVPQLSSTDAFRLSERAPAERLSGGDPLTLAVDAIAAPLCPWAATDSAPRDLGDGSMPIAGAKAIAGPNSLAWWSGAGDESGWTLVGQDGGVDTGDCNLETGGAFLQMRDRGRRSEFLHIDTGLPLGLPLSEACPLTMRVYASSYSEPSGDCRDELFADHIELWLFSYDGATSVDAGSRLIVPVAATAGPDTSTLGCATDYVDVDLSSLYSNATGTTTFQLRLIPEASGNINQDDGTRIRLVPEIYLHI